MQLKKVVLTLKNNEKIIVPIFADKTRGYHLDPISKGNDVQSIKFEYDDMASTYTVSGVESYSHRRKKK